MWKEASLRKSNLPSSMWEGRDEVARRAQVQKRHHGAQEVKDGRYSCNLERGVGI